MSGPQGAGLCGACSHARRVTNRQGSTFLLCRRSEEDPGFPRYPMLPLFRCRGFEAAPPPPPPDTEG